MRQLKRKSFRKAQRNAGATNRMNYDVLESRHLLAGDVSAVLSAGGTLTITGDEFDNGIQISQFEDGDVIVHGFDCGGGGTLINGGDDGDYQTFSEVENIVVITAGGDDCVAATNDIWSLVECLDFDDIPDDKTVFNAAFGDDLAEKIFIPGRLQIFTGTGNDAVGVGWFETGSVMDVITGSGDDLVGLCNVCVGTTLSVVTASGEDNVLIGGFNSDSESEFKLANVIGTSAIINSGNHDDTVCVENLETVTGAVIVNTAGGDDVATIGVCFDDPNEPEGGKNGFVSVFADTDLLLHMGSGDDYGQINHAQAGRNLISTLGGGHDDLHVHDVRVDNLTNIDAGGGDDYVSVHSVESRLLYVYMGSGDDNLSVGNSSADSFRARGNGGFDCLTTYDNNFLTESITSFEDFDCDD